MSIFKVHDIRGLYPTDLDEAKVFKIGLAYVSLTQVKKVVVGYDMRPSSLSLFDALTDALTSQGVDVINIGLCSSPICYYANGKLAADGSIMITASHNGPGWNGLKLCIKGAEPMSYDRGIKEIEDLVESDSLPSPVEKRGKVENLDFIEEYGKSVLKHVHFQGRPKIVVDYANAMGSKEIEAIEHLFEIIPLYKELDGTFPNHEANPLRPETLTELQKQVVANGAVLGAAFDGDADRCGFVDNTGEIVNMDLIIALIAQDIIETHGPKTILYDVRSSKSVPEAIEAAGGIAKMTRVGHSLIKNDMRIEQAYFAGELSGHYYFSDNYYSESQATVLVMLCNILEKKKMTLEELVKPLRKYANSGEINRPIKNSSEVLRLLREKYADGKQFELDGLSVNYSNWWFNVRPSNTEPKLRILIEADNKELLSEKQKELLSLIDGLL
ncbi:MAG: phosphomannomutase/phosphoglucomutase [Lentisphaeraceae bacterium]|nr:phosphomannomutase/phosphoglucomutase [Lentisphaeraceae bacterium]